MRILIVEDSQQQRDLYRLQLRDVVSEIVEVRNGYEACRQDWLTFDVVLLDLLMPGMHGGEVLAWAVDNYGLEMPPVVVFTALSNGPLQEFTRKFGKFSVEIYQKTGKRDSVLRRIRDAITSHENPHSSATV